MNAATIDASIAATAGEYSTFAGVLAGIAFTGLCIYLQLRPKPDDKQKDRSSDRSGTIAASDVAAATFYTMMSLGISSFLYGHLDGMASGASPNPGQDATALLWYGIIFALSVLSLFYCVALMGLENPLTEKLGKHAYWAITIAGSVIVLRFLGQSTQFAFVARCYTGCGGKKEPKCSNQCIPGLLSTPGIWVTLGIAIALALLVGAAFFDFGLRTVPRGLVGKALYQLKRSPVAAPLWVFIVSSLVAITMSLYLSTRDPSYKPSELLIYISYSVSILVIALFALACGRVLPHSESFEFYSMFIITLCLFGGLFYIADISAFYVIGPAIIVVLLALRAFFD